MLQTFTTYFNDASGQHVYLDWDTGVWANMPAAWLQEAEEIREEEGSMNPAGDENEVGDFDKMERFYHPISRIQYESSFEGGQRLFFDDRTNSWEQIPVALEQYVPAIARALGKVQPFVPAGTSATEQVLALRMNGYSVHHTVAWWQNEASFKAPLTSPHGVGQSAGSPDGAVRHSESASQIAELDTQRRKAERKAAELVQENALLTGRMAQMEKQLQELSSKEMDSSAKATGLDDKLSVLVRFIS